MIKAVLFDLDNTLIDFMRMKRISCEAAISAMIDAGLDMPKDKAMKRLFTLYDKYGLEHPQIFQFFLKKVEGDVDYKILASGVSAYRKVRYGFLEPYPHVIPTLLKIKMAGVKIAIVSDAPKLKAWLRLTSMKVADYFDHVVTYDDTLAYKPNSLPFKMVMRLLKVKPEECLMVGDRPERDIVGAKKVGMQTCFAKYGNRNVTLSGADYEIEEISELVDILGISKKAKDKK